MQEVEHLPKEYHLSEEERGESPVDEAEEDQEDLSEVPSITKETQELTREVKEDTTKERVNYFVERLHPELKQHRDLILEIVEESQGDEGVIDLKELPETIEAKYSMIKSIAEFFNTKMRVEGIWNKIKLTLASSDISPRSAKADYAMQLLGIKDGIFVYPGCGSDKLDKVIDNLSSDHIREIILNTLDVAPHVEGAVKKAETRKINKVRPEVMGYSDLVAQKENQHIADVLYISTQGGGAALGEIDNLDLVLKDDGIIMIDNPYILGGGDSEYEKVLTVDEINCYRLRKKEMVEPTIQKEAA